MAYAAHELHSLLAQRAPIAPRMDVHSAGTVIRAHVSEMMQITAENRKCTILATAKSLIKKLYLTQKLN